MLVAGMLVRGQPPEERDKKDDDEATETWCPTALIMVKNGIYYYNAQECGLTNCTTFGTVTDSTLDPLGYCPCCQGSTRCPHAISTSTRRKPQGSSEADDVPFIPTNDVEDFVDTKFAYARPYDAKKPHDTDPRWYFRRARADIQVEEKGIVKATLPGIGNPHYFRLWHITLPDMPKMPINYQDRYIGQEVDPNDPDLNEIEIGNAKPDRLTIETGTATRDKATSKSKHFIRLQNDADKQFYNVVAKWPISQ